MGYAINDITNVLSDLARPNKYRVVIADLGGDSEVGILAKAASVPGKTVGTVEVYAQGRKVPIAGDANYDTWSCTFYIQKTFKIREDIEKWMTDIDDYMNNLSNETTLAEYQKEIEIEQLDRKGNVIKTFVLKNAWPTTVGEVTLGADTNDSVEELEVTFNYTHYEVK